MVYQTRTNYIFVHSKRKVLFTFGALIIRDEVVNETDTASFVGVIFDKHLSWKDLIEYVENCARKKSGILFK